jgi:DNA-directed RNA polymerase subunit RPC12/RpoP
MLSQVQCPNCGGYKVSVQDKTILASEKQKMPATIPQTLLGYIFGLLFIAYFVMSVVQNLGFFAFIGTGLLALLGIRLLYGTAKGELTQSVTVPTLVVYDYKCEICGYKWTWRTDQSLPHVQVRPELIAKIESQRWKCIRCGNINEGIQSSCSYCYAPKM